MMKAIRMACTALALTASVAQAQRFGASGSYGTDTEIGVGGRVEFDMANMLSKSGPLSKAFFVGQADFFFDACNPADCTMLDINPGIAVPLGADNKFFAGAGLNIARMTVDRGSLGKSSNTDTGINVLGGIRFPMGGMDAFSEARLSLGGAEQLVLSLGVKFGKRTP